MTTKINSKRDARFYVDAVGKRGGHLPSFIDAFPETGITRDRGAIVSPPCLGCGSKLVGDDANDARETGSSLRLMSSDSHLEGEFVDGLTRQTMWTLACAAGGSCSYTMSTKQVLTMALEAVGAAEFMRRARAVQAGDYVPREKNYYAVFLPNDRGRGSFMSTCSPVRALDKLNPGRGVAVMLQVVSGIDQAEAEKQLDPERWETCDTDATGALLRAADIEARDAAKLEEDANTERESKIRAKLDALEAKLRATK